MKRLLLLAAALTFTSTAAPPTPVRTYEGTLTVPTYTHSGRELEPPLFANSSATGLYPFPTYRMPFLPGSPKPQTYRAVFLENEYLKLSYIPEFGGRIFSLYDKIRNREVFYRNDVIKPAPYNPRLSWPQSGLELTGPHDVHMLTLHGEPFWSHTIVKAPGGAISLVLAEIDPIYQMKVNLTATLHPGVAALEIGVFCFNSRDARMPQMFWINTAVPATPQTRFLYQMSRTVGHTTSEIADWPIYQGTDYSWDRNNQNMLGVFGIDIYDNFHGAFQFENNYGLFRYADRRLVQGMKLWTFGNGPAAQEHVRGYTDHAGPYVELQSGRHVWDGHYEWVPPHRIEGWSEWWIPVAGTNGLTALSPHVALNLTTKESTLELDLAAIRPVPSARLNITAATGPIATETIHLDPAHPLHKSFPIPTTPNAITTATANPSATTNTAAPTNPSAPAPLTALRITITAPNGASLLDYTRPDTPPGRKEYSPFTRSLEEPRKSPDAMSAEELTAAAEYRLKELDSPGAQALLDRALALDPGFSRAHLLQGINAFAHRRPTEAIPHLEKAIARDPYLAEAHYYLALSLLATNRRPEAERALYNIWPDSPYYGLREYHLGRLLLLDRNPAAAIPHLKQSILANGMDLTARLSLALAYRESSQPNLAAQTLDAITPLDPANPTAAAERFLANAKPAVSTKPASSTAAKPAAGTTASTAPRAAATAAGSPAAPQTAPAPAATATPATTAQTTPQTELLRLLGHQTQEALSLTTFYRDLHRYPEAARLLTLAAQSNRDPWGTSPVFYYTLAYCHRAAGNPTAANAALEQARAASPNIDRFPFRPESEAPLAEAIAQNPNDFTAHLALARLLYHLGRPAEALSHWEAATKLRPADFSAHRELGLAAAEQGLAPAQSTAHLERAIELRPDHLPTLNDLSALYARTGAFGQQAALLTQALARSPNDDDLAESLLTAHLIQGHYDDADRLIESRRFAVRHRNYTLRDRYRFLRAAIAARLLREAKPAEALQALQSALHPPASLGIDDFAGQDSPRLLYYTGLALEALHRPDEARQAYEKATAPIPQLSGDRDSWNSENVYILYALDRLNRTPEANTLAQRFQNFALTESESRNATHRAEANYLLALLQNRQNHPAETHALLTKSLQARPDLLGPRLELRHDLPTQPQH